MSFIRRGIPRSIARNVGRRRLLYRVALGRNDYDFHRCLDLKFGLIAGNRRGRFGTTRRAVCIFKRNF